jgi:hypothetical protein
MHDISKLVKNASYRLDFHRFTQLFFIKSSNLIIKPSVSRLSSKLTRFYLNSCLAYDVICNLINVKHPDVYFKISTETSVGVFIYFQ